MNEGYVQIYTGNGKGKTTAALGLALRASGRGLRVAIVQFMKGSDTGELHAIGRLEGVSLYRVSASGRFVWEQSPEEGQAMRDNAVGMLSAIGRWFAHDEVDVLILDEAMAAIASGIVTLDDILDLLNRRPSSVEMILTGRNAPPELIDRAHLVTRMEPVKHYLSQGIRARKGIEY